MHKRSAWRRKMRNTNIRSYYEGMISFSHISLASPEKQCCGAFKSVCAFLAQFPPLLFSRLFGGTGRLMGTCSLPLQFLLHLKKVRTTNSVSMFPNLFAAEFAISPRFHAQHNLTKILPFLTLATLSNLHLTCGQSANLPYSKYYPWLVPCILWKRPRRHQKRAVIASRLMVGVAINFISTYLRSQK